MGIQECAATFVCQGQRLRGLLALPGPRAPCIFMSHGFEASMRGTKWSYLSPRLSEQGYAIFRFNYRGCGEGDEKSEGDFEDTTLSSRIADYRAALDFLETSNIDQGRIGVIGSSFGGEVAMAAQDPRVKAYVLLATPSRSTPPTDEQMEAYRRLGHIPLPTGKRLKLAYYEDVQRYDLCKAIRTLGRPVLIVHGELDKDVPLDNARELYIHASGPKRLEIIEGGHHALRRPKDMARILELTLEWLRRYL